MNIIFRRWLNKRKSRIQRRLDKKRDTMTFRPVISASNIRYEVADKTRAITCGGIGAIHLLAQRLGLSEAIDQRLHLFKIHLPYHESDHVLNFAYNALCGGTCLQHLEQLRTNENFLDALGAQRIPDPTTAGDFCRRFTLPSIHTLIEIFNDVRVRAWADQPAEFFDCARLDLDGSLVETTGACKAGMDIAYNGTWGYHPLIVSLANTGEILSIVNRPGNRPSHEGAALEIDRAVVVCLQGGFRMVLLRGDTDFSQTQYLDRWDRHPRIRFLFGYDATPNLQQIADDLPASAWKPLERPLRYRVKTKARRRPAQVKEQIVRERGFENLRLRCEDVAEFEYRPSACSQSYRMVVVRKNLSKEKGELVLFDEERYFFYITNVREATAADIVFTANDRCDQENVLAQLKGGCWALRAPVDSLESNWAYMLMTALAWNLKAWWALALPAKAGRWCERHQQEKRWVQRLEFRSFVQAFVHIPCQIIKTSRQLVYRLLGWNQHLPIFFRLLDVLRC